MTFMICKYGGRGQHKGKNDEKNQTWSVTVSKNRLENNNEITRKFLVTRSDR